MTTESSWADNVYRDICIGCAALKAQAIIQSMHPLEVIRTRLQSHDGGAKSNLVPDYKGSI